MSVYEVSDEGEITALMPNADEIVSPLFILLWMEILILFVLLLYLFFFDNEDI